MLSLEIAQKFRKGRRQSGMLSLISVISTLSISIGIAALIIGLSAMNGFERELNNRVLAVVPHGEFFTRDVQGLSNWQGVEQQINQNLHIIASAPFIRFTGLVENGNHMQAIQVEGVDLNKEQKFSELHNYILNDKWSTLKSDNKQIILGIGLAKTLAVKEGDKVTLLIPSTDNVNQLKQPKRIRLTVAGIMNFSGNLGNNLALIPLLDAQHYLNMGDNVTGVKVNVDNILQAETIINQVMVDSTQPLYASSWIRTYGYMYRDIQLIRQIMYLAMVVVIGVACFSIMSALVIAVKDKQRDIAILRTLGASNKLISKVFVWYGLISGLIGSSIGTLLGVLISIYLSDMIKLFESLTGHQVLNSHIYFIDFIPSEVHILDVAIVFITAMLLTLIASQYPARRACKVDPIKILNGY